MPDFEYEVINRQGQISSGKITADSSSAAVLRLRDTGVTVLSINEAKSASSAKLRSEKKVSIADLALFSRQLASMVGAGIPVTRAIATLSKQTTNAALARALEAISRDVESGTNLTDAFSRHPKIFNQLYVSMISAGEVGGILETTLSRLSEQLQKEKQLADNVKSATSYPKMLCGFAFFMFVAMLVFLVPVFEGFIPNKDNLPGFTKAIFALSGNVRGFWYIWLAAIALLVFAAISFLKSNTGHELWENYKIKMPVFGQIILKSVIARFSRTLSTLLDGGIPVVQAMKSAGPTSGSDLVARAVEKAIVRIEEGSSISVPLEQSGLFPPMVTHMIAVGEESGTLPSLLNKVAEFYEDDVAALSKQLGAILEPIMIITIGILIGGMLVALYLPMFTAVTSM
ncbi:MAG TPA: type II secretion system F family protein [Ruminococcaceae bacterium]|nr:type II secretion system F family protein [Oscillospiraceae bacterium]